MIHVPRLALWNILREVCTKITNTVSLCHCILFECPCNWTSWLVREQLHFKLGHICSTVLEFNYKTVFDSQWRALAYKPRPIPQVIPEEFWVKRWSKEGVSDSRKVRSRVHIKYIIHLTLEIACTVNCKWLHCWIDRPKNEIAPLFIFNFFYYNKQKAGKVCWTHCTLYWILNK